MPRWPRWWATTRRPAACWWSPSRATATCGSRSPRNSPGIIVRYVEGYCSAVQAVPGGRGQDDRTRYADAPQILVPSRRSAGFVRLLGRSTRFRRTFGNYAVDPAVPVLGRWLSFFAERAEHPSSCLLLAATDSLGQHWATGQSAVQDQNLATLVGWIDPPDGMTGAQAAAAGEDPVTWPPAGPATDPTFDNEVLAPLIAACGRPDAGDRARQRAETALRAALAGQLAPAWRLMWRAVGLLRGLPPRQGGGALGRGQGRLHRPSPGASAMSQPVCRQARPGSFAPPPVTRRMGTRPGWQQAGCMIAR